MTITKVVYNYLDSTKDGTIISGWELFKIINSQTGKKTYPSTLLQMCRNYCDSVGGDFECINARESTYKFHKGAFIIGKLQLVGKE